MSLQEYFQWRTMKGSPVTAQNYFNVVGRFLDHTQVPVEKVTLSHVISFLAPYQPRSQATYANALRDFFKFAGRRELMEQVPIPGFTPAEARVLSREELDKFLAFPIREHDQVLLRTVYDLALRVGELGLMKGRDINLSEKTAVVHRLKGRKGIPRSVEMPLDTEGEETLALLEPYAGKSDLIFPEHKVTVCDRVLNLSKRAGLGRVTVHTLRHTKGTNLAKLGWGPFELAKFMGHVDPKTTMVYVHLAAKDMKS